MSLDDLLEAVTKPSKERVDLSDIMKKLDEMERLLRQIASGADQRSYNYDRTCEELLGKLYIITSSNVTKTRPNLVALEMSGGKYLVLHRDTYNFMKLIFEIYRTEEEIVKHMDVPHTTLFNLLKREGLIYFDAEKRAYTFV